MQRALRLLLILRLAACVAPATNPSTRTASATATYASIAASKSAMGSDPASRSVLASASHSATLPSAPPTLTRSVAATPTSRVTATSRASESSEATRSPAATSSGSPSTVAWLRTYTVDAANIATDALCGVAGQCKTLRAALQAAAAVARPYNVNPGVLILVYAGAGGAALRVPPLAVSELTPSLTIAGAGQSPVVLAFDPADAQRDELARGDCVLTVRGAGFALKGVELVLAPGTRAPACGVGFAAAFGSLVGVTVVGLPATTALFMTLPCAPAVLPSFSPGGAPPPAHITLSNVTVRASATPALVLLGVSVGVCSTGGGAAATRVAFFNVSVADALGARFLDARALTTPIEFAAARLALGNVSAGDGAGGALVAGPTAFATSSFSLADTVVSRAASGANGALWLPRAGAVALTNTTFTDVGAASGCAAVNVVLDATLAGVGFSIHGCSFSNVRAGGSGGAVSVNVTCATTCSCVAVSVAQTAMTNVSARLRGGALAVVAVDAACVIATLGVAVSGTASDGAGGAVYAALGTASGASLALTGAFADSVSVESGGAVFATAPSILVSDATAARCRCTEASCAGGAFALFAAVVSVANVSTDSCAAAALGGSFSVAAGMFYVSGSTFARSRAAAGGCAAIFSAMRGDSAVSSSVFSGCVASGGAAALRMAPATGSSAAAGIVVAAGDATTVTVGGGGLLLVTVPSNDLLASLGLAAQGPVAWAMVASPSAPMTLNNVSFVNCTAAGSGGGGGFDVVAYTPDFRAFPQRIISLTLTRCAFAGNAAGGSGGGFRANGKVLSGAALDGVVLSSNVAATGGGAIFEAINFAVIIRDCALRDNAALDAVSGGGALALVAAVAGSSLAFDRTTLFGNTAAGIGGAAWVDGAAVVLVNYSSLAANKATSGGALAVTGGVLAVTLTTVVALANQATGAGAMAAGSTAVASGTPLGGGALFFSSQVLNAPLEIAGAADAAFLSSAVAAAAAAALARGGEGALRTAAAAARPPAVAAPMVSDSSFSLAALAAQLAAALAAAPQRYSCVFAVNSATEGMGGDVQSGVTSVSFKVSVEKLLSVGASAASGGSFALSTFGTANFAACTWLNASAGGRLLSPAETAAGSVYNAQTDTFSTPTWVSGAGGALLLRPSVKLVINASVIKGATAHYGAGLWLQRALSGCANDARVLSCPNNFLDSVDTSGLASSANRAWVAGGNAYVDLGPASSVASTNASGSTADVWGYDVATGPRSAKLVANSTQLSAQLATVTWAGSQLKPTTLITLLVIGGATSITPLLVFHVVDELGALCASDNECV